MDRKNLIKDYFAKQEDLLCAYLFGSAAEGKENKFSDVDIGVLFNPGVAKEEYSQKKLRIMDDLSRILDRNIDIVVLNEADSFLNFQVIKDGQRIYESPKRDNHDFEAYAIIQYLDFLPVRKRLETALINNIKKR